MSGWIKLHRAMLEWGWYHDINVCRVFTHILLKANFKESFYESDKIGRGELMAGYPALSQQTGLSVQQVRTAITKLKSTGEITVRKRPKYSIITIRNYDKFQDDNSHLNSESTGEQQPINSPSTGEQQHLKKDKKEKNVKNERSSTETRLFNSEFDEVWPMLESYPNNKNYNSAKERFASVRRKGHTKDEIMQYYQEKFIGDREPRYVTQFYKAITADNLKAWKKHPSYTVKALTPEQKAQNQLDRTMGREETYTGNTLEKKEIVL